MELRAIKYFLQVYEQGSVSGAAKRCFVSQPSITTAIQSLEASLNTPLFVRHARGVLPTPAADKLYPKAKAMAEQEKSILNLFHDSPTSTPLRLGIMRSMGAVRMSQLLRQLSKDIDQLELTLVDPEEPCDAKIMAITQPSASDKFIPIWQDDYQLAIPSHWPLATQAVIGISDLEGVGFINREPCSALAQLKEKMNQQGVLFTHRANIRTIDYAWPLVSAGVGAALVPNWQEIQQADGLVLKPITDFRFSQSIGLVIATQRTPLVESVVQSCLGFARQL